MGARRGILVASVLSVVCVAAAVTVISGSASGQAADPTSDGTSPPASVTNSTLPASTSEMQVIAQVPYYPGGPTFDAYLPKDGKDLHPALIMVHGGGWESGDMLELAPFAVQAATDQHWAAFTVDYRLDAGDKDAWADELHDVQASIRFIVSQASTYGIDPNNVVLMGDSAGANLAAVVSSVGTADPVTGTAVGSDPSTEVPIKAVALWSPPVDLADLVGQGGEPPAACGSDAACAFIWTGPDVVDYIGCEPAACPQKYADASPITWASAKTLPSYIANSSDELVPIEQVEAYVDALQKAGVPVQFQELPGSLHAVEYGGEVWEPTVEFLSRYLSAEPRDDSSKDEGRPVAVVVAGVLGAVALCAIVLLLRRVGRRRRRPSTTE